VERTQSSGEITLRGVIQDGVEPGCHLIRVDGGGLYLLLGGDVSNVRPGGRVEVVGVPKPLLATTCQQGTPLQVTSIRAI
jgi:hypothetical protein